MRELGLVHDFELEKEYYKVEKEQSYYSDLKRCLKEYERVYLNGRFKSILHRFYGFRTNGGIDMN